MILNLRLTFSRSQFYLDMSFTELVSAVNTSFSKELATVDEKLEGPDALAAFIDAIVRLLPSLCILSDLLLHYVLSNAC